MEETKQKSNVDTFKQAISRAGKGFVSNGLAILICQPFDTLRFQSQSTNKSLNARGLIRNIYQKQSIPGFYRGLGASLVTQPTAWTIFFPIYYWLDDNVEFTENKRANDFINSNIAGAVSVVASNPLWVLRTRMQTEVLVGDRNRYGTFFQDVIRNEGVSSLYKGTGITLFKNIQMGIQFPVYNYFQQHRYIETILKQYISSDTMSTHIGTALNAGAAKLISSSVMYPIDTIRTRIRGAKGRVTIGEIVKQIMKEKGGPANFFRGIQFYWLAQGPIFAITMMMMEKLKSDEDKNKT